MKSKLVWKHYGALLMSILLLVSTLSFSLFQPRQAYAASLADTKEETKSDNTTENGIRKREVTKQTTPDTVIVQEPNVKQEKKISVTEAIRTASELILSSGTISEWEAIGLARAGQTVPTSYLSAVEQELKNKEGYFRKVTDYERIAIAVKAAGGDPTSIAGYNLIEKIYNHDRMLVQGLNGPIFALIALDCGNYQIPEDAKWNRDKLLTEILSKQNEDGGFSLSPGMSDPDITGMTLTALAPYTDKTEVKTASERAVNWLSKSQKPHGGYASAWGEDSSESVAQAIIALTAHGIDPTEARFTKEENNLVSNLMTFRQEDGGFAHVLGGSTNNMATEQALQALVAYDLFMNGKGGLYRFTTGIPEPNPVVQATIRIEGPKGPITAGDISAATALEGLEKLLTEKNIPYRIEDSQYGKYAASINHIDEGQYGGYDGWLFAILRDGKWVIPNVGMAEYTLKESDQVVVYYGGSNTQLIDSITVHPAQPKADEPFTVAIMKTAWDWQAGKQVITPAADVQVAVGNKVEKTNDQGIASIKNGMTAGTYTVTVNDYHDSQAPGIVRSTKELVVATNGTTPGGGGGGGVPVPAKQTITLSVTGDSQKGTILAAKSIELKAGDTAYTVLARELGSKVESRGSGPTLYVEAIDGLGEFDRGPQSGWMYSVNGWFPNYSAGIYTLKNGDVLAWRYTLNLGKDLGADLGGSQLASGAVTESIPMQLDNEINKVGLPIDNMQPIEKVGKTTAVLNAKEKMSASQAEQIQKTLASHTVSLSQNVSAAIETVMKDNEEEVGFVVPAAALPNTISIAIKEQTAERPELVSSLYDFTPDGTKFSKPVYISIKVPVQMDIPDNLSLVWLDEKNNQWIPIPAVIDAKTGIITGKVNHFTKFAVIDRSKIKMAQQHKSVSAEIAAVSRQILNSGELTDWEAFALARAGQNVPASYLLGVEKLLREQKGEFRKVTDYERIALAVKAVGGDPTNIAGYNLIEKIYNHERMTSQGINGPVFALLVLDSGQYNTPAEAKWTRDTLIAWIVQQQNSSGGFPLVKGEEDNVDITAMAITALSSYQERPEVKVAVEKAVHWLSQAQLKNGGYKLFGDENSESVSQVIIALSALGIDLKDKRFVKSNTDLLTNLLSFKNNDGGYSHVMGQPTNEIATEQALMALSAYERFTQGQDRLYHILALQLVETPQLDIEKFVDEHTISPWASAAVYAAYERKLVGGVSTTELRFAPKQPMTRAQFATLLLKAMNESPAMEAKQTFADVKQGSWYYGYVMKAKEKGIIQGATPTLFKPEQPITRQEMAMMITQAFQLKAHPSTRTFKDQSKVYKPALSHVQAVHQQGIMVGYDGYFYPTATVTREMGAVVAVKLHEEMVRK
ncbi:S-layer homology domain-containing protein [Aneurinibacillus migulanus]|uniref:S-layer homology domain-containing protein n=1 Tax=Aneurinibacillus migulanus TaxID=47500 RepID=UPI00209DBB89|nr:S-layer homology domain-containing protein [Aneurinibacillus migulanus]